MEPGRVTSLLSKLRGAALEEMFGTPMHAAFLGGPLPEKLAFYARDPLPGDSGRGEAMLDGHWRFGPEKLDLTSPRANDPWLVASPSRRFAKILHGFSWLRDLSAVGAPGAAASRRLVDSWIESFGRYNQFAWDVPVLAERILSWSRRGQPVFEDDDANWRGRAFESFARQFRHLALAVPGIGEPSDRLRASAALVVGAAVMLEERRRIDSALDLLERAVESQILPDGGHISRRPDAIAEALSDLVSVEDALTKIGATPPVWLRSAMDRLAPMLRFFTLGDDHLAAFHGGGRTEPATLQGVLSAAGAPGRPFGYAPYSGFQRVSYGAITLLMDVGAAPPAEFAHQAHASCLAIETTIGSARLFVSCGSRVGDDPKWRAAARTTAAHSTLELGGASSAVVETGKAGRVAPSIIGPPGVSARRTEEDKGVWIEARHDGYRQEFGLVHRRRVYVSIAGDDLRGEDSLIRPIADGRNADGDKVPFAVRFHLHPDVRAALSFDKHSVTLALPGGAVWRFRTDHEASLQESIYFASGSPRKSLQIVLSGEADPNGDGAAAPNRVMWRLAPAETA
ncbi:MAG: heparinase II/III family protein [Caulobacterales bacterium]